ncbi:MAG: tRNA (adenosine(37)-N6)-threonylcarbamoyltransferase complex dimerization subunit type 1 TsaB [Nitrospirota bacterium]|nr:tRNA (adenosine(37)-N6)-threonylcarbamoyltransferase complex dimerization subunit type 1 TsaB [Nitrospirota bacterium]
MNVLAVETATGRQSVALMDGSRVLAQRDRDAAGHHAKYLVPTIDEVFKTAGCELSDVQALAVSIGPGSFTGLRVGLATMMGFRMVTGLPLAAVPTLEAMAWNLRGSTQTICPVLKSRTGEVYWALYRWQDTGLIRIGEEQVGPLDKFARAMTPPTIIYGEGWQANREELRRLFTSLQIPIQEGATEVMAASAVSVGLAGMEKIRNKDIAGYGISPRYVQRAEAEIMMDRRLAGA